MPLVPNEKTNHFHSSFVATATAVKTVVNSAREMDEKVRTECLAQSRKLVCEHITRSLATIASEIHAETREPSGNVTIHQIARNAPTVAESSELPREQFERRGVADFTQAAETYGREVMDSEVLHPITRELEEAGFTGVKFMWDVSPDPNRNRCALTLSLTLDLPAA